MHRKTFCLASILLGVLTIVPADVVGQQKKNNNKATPGTPQDYHFLEQAKMVTGQILAIDDSAKTISIRVDANEWVPNPNYKPNNNQYVQLMRHQSQLA